MDIWAKTRGAEHIRPLEGQLWRMVESQTYIATRKLVDTQEEQRILEEVLEGAKPPALKRNSRGQLHYLLFTPFRYPPLRHGGRFHTAYEPSLFYASRELKTAMAEIAYRRFVFMADTQARLEPAAIAYTHFAVKVKTDKGIDLTAPPFTAHQSIISDPCSYVLSQPLGAAMRGEGIQAFCYASARLPGGMNAGLLTPEAFAQNRPLPRLSGEWNVYESGSVIDFHLKDPTAKPQQHSFARGSFLVDGILPLAH